MAQIIASVFAESRDQVLRLAGKAAMAGADWVELRLDRWPAGGDLAAVIAGIRLPVLVTCHTPENGGHFRGTLGERRELLTHALQAGAQGLDLDHTDGWSPPAGRTGLRLLVRSFHSLTGVPKELPAILKKLQGMPCTVAKIAVTAHDLADAAPVLDLMRGEVPDGPAVVAFAMGRTAWPTRVLACLFGAPIVYGSVEPGGETAVGQPPVELLAQLYRVHTLGRGTALFGLLGNPALHSFGPWLHNRAFRRLGVDGVYLPFETSRPEAVFDMLRQANLQGLSVTAPFKAAMIARCTRLGDDAAATGAVNTMVRESDGGFFGGNTDVDGVRAALTAAGAGDGEGKEAVVIGSGGAARAGAYALLRMGYGVTMLGRSLDGARAFARDHGVRLGSLSARLPEGLDPAVVVQATPLGSLGRDPEERPLADFRARPGQVVLDMVYRPLVTRFLRDAQAEGASAISGMEMFLWQARAQVKRFTGATVEPAELRRSLAGAS